MIRDFLTLSASVLLFVAPVLAQLPYEPHRIISASNGSLAYIFTPQTSSTQSSLSILNTSDIINATSSIQPLFRRLPFLSNTQSRAYIPVADEKGLTVLTDDCGNGAQGIQLWRFSLDDDKQNGTWKSLHFTLSDATLSVNYLSAGFTFSPTDSLDDASMYVFGGMCPDGASSNSTDWTVEASYSNTMLTVSTDAATSAATPYQLALTGSRAPPIAEAGLTITPLVPTFSNTSTSYVSQQQNFVLLGGHTQGAFINMSQVALYSLPQESWAFIGVDQPADSGNTELMSRSSTLVEPRSGHTAVLTEDGTKIVMFGGWVGDLTTAAEPQLAILTLGEGYGGQADWTWTIPTAHNSPFSSNEGIYGHGAAMLPGGVMVVTGGHSTASSGSKAKRQAANDLLFFNTTSLTWVDSYINPSSAQSSAHKGGSSSSSGMKTTSKAGLGAGLGFGFAAAGAVAVFWLLYSRRLRKRRAIREKELRELAFGAERYHSPSLAVTAEDARYPQMRSASWHSMQERHIEGSGGAFPWAPVISEEQAGRMRMEREDQEGNGLRQAERTGLLMDIPSPTRGLRRGLHSRGPGGYPVPAPGGAPSVFRIDEEEEGSQGGSVRRIKTPKIADRVSVQSDPFRDPPTILQPAQQDEAAHQRKKEVQGWVDDWTSAAESMNLSRNPSQAQSRTYSNLSQSHTNPNTSSDPSGRGSPEKSDRTGSNLSERSLTSVYSIQKSVTGTVSRNISQRSASAGYALFSGAAAAMGRLRPPQAESTMSGVARAPSQRTMSLNMNSTSSRTPKRRDRAETVSSVRTSLGPILPGEDQGLLNRGKAAPDDYFTPPESPTKERYSRTSSLTSSGRRALNMLGSVRRVFTGTGTVDVQDRVANLEAKSTSSSPTKSIPPEMSEGPKRTLSAGSFWKGKAGARDWGDEASGAGLEPATSTIRRKPVPGQQVVLSDAEGTDDEDWDIETAIQKRVVQVMFTVPKEKLRVVNADALSLLSSNRSEVDQDEEKDRAKDLKRMSGVIVKDEKSDEEDKGKGKDVGWDLGYHAH